MKKNLTIVICILIIAAVVVCLYIYKKPQSVPQQPAPENPNSITDMQQIPQDDPNTEVNEREEYKNENNMDDSTIYTEVGIYSGKIDSNSVEILLGDSTPLLVPCRLSPEVAAEFSSLDLEEDSIVSFEYKIVDEQYVITKFIK